VYLIDLRSGELLRKLFASPVKHDDITGLTFCGGTTSVAVMTAGNELSVYHTDGTRMITIMAKADGPIRYADHCRERILS
jgi:hypothetical protein